MRGRKRLMRVVAVLAVALATGQAVESVRSSAAGTAQTSGLSNQVSGLPSSASLGTDAAAIMPDLRGITPVAAVVQRPADNTCAPSLSLVAAAEAMIDLALLAPCNAGERVVFRHSGLSFAALVGRDGRLSASVPAMAREALVTAYFEGSSVALATVSVPDAASRTRFAFQAPDPVDFVLRAEAGGMVHVGGLGKPGGVGPGRILTLGSPAVQQPMIAQVYTFSGFERSTAKVSVEVRISDMVCGRSFVGETVLSRGGNATFGTVPITIPLCGASGDILVLRNLVPQPTLAAPR